jgi:hypothetical protein
VIKFLSGSKEGQNAHVLLIYKITDDHQQMIWFMVFNVTFNYISVLLVEETLKTTCAISAYHY